MGPASRASMAVTLIAAVAIAGCTAASQPTPTPTPSPTATPSATPTPVPTASPTPLPTLGGQWSAADSGDTALMDRLLQIWTDDEVEALDEVYDEGVLLVTGWAGVQGTLEEIAAGLPSIPNTYTRVSGVTVTTEQVPGLWSMRRGSRYVHCVAEIHAQLFDVVLEVSDADRVVVHYAYEYEEPDVRLRDGFPSVATPAPSAS